MADTVIENVTPYDSAGRRLDEKGRPPVVQMTDIEMLTEITTALRLVGDVIGQFDGLNPQQMIGLLLKGGR